MALPPSYTPAATPQLSPSSSYTPLPPPTPLPRPLSRSFSHASSSSPAMLDEILLIGSPSRPLPTSTNNSSGSSSTSSTSNGPGRPLTQLLDLSGLKSSKASIHCVQAESLIFVRAPEGVPGPDGGLVEVSHEGRGVRPSDPLSLSFFPPPFGLPRNAHDRLRY
jgi:hypothetical protein